jgi:succinate dehydrogenase / fumarate reductase, cytochrome b subunit
MLPLRKALDSSIGRKFVMSISGISLVGFIIVHLLGNIPLYFRDSTAGADAFNAYGLFLESFGPLLTVAELGLFAVFLIHIVWAFRITLKNKAARGTSYDAGIRTKGGPSHLNPASRSMIITGIVLLVFLIVHVGTFRVGKLFRDKVALSDGRMAYDIYGIALDTFSNPFFVVFYTVVMLFLGAHLSHGLWSWLQSLGAMKPQWSKPIYAAGTLIAVALAAGFLFIPIYIFFMHGGV